MSNIRDLKNKLIEKALENPTSSRFLPDTLDAVNAIEILTRVEVMESEHMLSDADPVQKQVEELVKSELRKKDIPF